MAPPSHDDDPTRSDPIRPEIVPGGPIGDDEAAESELVGSAGGGKVEVTVTGGGEFRHVRISPDVVDPADVSLLEDLVLAALRDAMARINAAQTAALGGLDLGALGGLLGDR